MYDTAQDDAGGALPSVVDRSENGRAENWLTKTRFAGVSTEGKRDELLTLMDVFN
jgi:hypothetical protein